VAYLEIYNRRGHEVEVPKAGGDGDGRVSLPQPIKMSGAA